MLYVQSPVRFFKGDTMTDDQKDAALLKRDWFWFVLLALLVLAAALIGAGIFRMSEANP